MIKRIYIKSVFLFCISELFAACLYSQTDSHNPNRLYSIGELREDFRFLRTRLEGKHQDLYQYTSRQEFNLFFDSLYNSINVPMTAQSFYNTIALLNSKIRDGHTMFLPGETAVIYFTKNEKFFPFYISIHNNRLFVNMNCSADRSIKEGAEIMSINGKPSSDIVDFLLARQIHDGNNQTYPVWILTNYFKEYYSFSFGHPGQFSIVFKEEGGKEVSKAVCSLVKDSIRYYRQANYANRILATTDKQGITLEINKETKQAVLAIRSFDKDILKSAYKQNYKQAIVDAFIQINNNQVQDLVLDIRNNQGGDWAPGTLLLSYLINQPLKFLENTKQSRLIIPNNNCYKQRLYMLINGGSFSVTGIIASYLELTNRGVFIGEEAAGNKTIISGEPVARVLPNTKIECQVPTTKFIIRSSGNDGHGVVPEFYVPFDSKSIIANRDLVMEKALSLIEEHKKK